MTGVSWRSQTGNTNEFALELALIDDPDAVDLLDEDVRTSWGTLSIWAAGVNLCSINGPGWAEEGTHWYLVGLTEWLIANWAPLFHEERLPLVNSSDSASDGALRGARAAEMAALVSNDYVPAELWQDWKHRHSLRTAEPEALLPDLYIRRYGDNLELSMGAARLPGAYTGATFPRIGTVRVPVVAAASAIHASLSNLVSELLRRVPDSKRLLTAQQKLSELLTPDPDDASALGWLAGLGDRHADFQALWNRIDGSLNDAARERARALAGDYRSSEVPSLVLGTPLSLLYGSLSPDVDDGDVVTLYKSVLEAPKSTLIRDELVRMHRQLRHDAAFEMSETPGEQGSVLGDAFHATYMVTDGDVNAMVDIEEFLARIGVWVNDVELNDDLTKGVSVLVPDGTVGILVNRNYRGGRRSAVRRFTLAHELGHLVTDQEYSRELIVASGPWAPVEIEKRANAFAAALLMPTTVIGRARAALRDGLDDERSVRALARTLDVSFSALVSRLQNLGLISFEDAEHWREGHSS